MTTAGEAASLFGGADVAEDPFALATRDVHEISGNDLFADLGPSDAADDPFNFVADNAAGETGHENYTSYDTPSYQGQGTGWSAPSTQDYGYGVPQSQYSTHAQPGTQPTYPSSNGWNDVQGQWAGHGAQQYNAVNGTYTNSSYPASTQTYDPYAPHAGPTYVPPAVSQAPPPEAPSYAPPATHNYNAYNIPSVQRQSSYESPYDPYKPQSGISKQTSHTQPAAPIHSSYPSFVDTSYVSAPAVPTIEPPPPARSAASAAPFRPKTSNAYDPPLLPPKPASKRPPAFQSPLGSPAAASYALGPGSPPASRVSAVHPPPRKASLPPPPPRTGSALRPSTASPVPLVQSAAYALPASHILSSAVPPPLPPPTQFTSPPPPVVHHTSPAAVHHSPPAVHHYGSPPTAHHPSPLADTPHAGPSAWSAESHDEPHRGDPTSSVHSDAEAPDSYWDRLGDDVADHEGHVPPVVANGTANAHFDPEAHTGDSWYDKELHGESTTSLDETLHIEAEVGPVDHKAASEAFDHEGFEDTHAPAVVNPTPTNVQHNVVSNHTSVSSAHATSPLPASVYDPYRPRGDSHSATSPPQAMKYARSPEVPAVSSWIHSSTSPPKLPPQSRSSTDSYEPRANQSYEPIMGRRTTASPSSMSVRSTHSTQSREGSIRDPYGLPEPPTSNFGARYRSMSNSSALSLNAASEDPYAPGRHSRHQSVESLSHGGVSLPHVFSENSSPAMPLASAQVITLAASTRAPYAPSPSLLGSNDPLGRTSVRVPIITFGFGGKMITCFHGSSTLHTGFDIAMSSRASTTIHMRSLSDVIPQSAIETSTAPFPGPLFADPGTPTATLVRTGASAQVKAKKAKVIQYLSERSDEISRGIGYLHQGSVEGHRAEAKRILINLLKVLVENDGRLSGSPQIDAAVHAALLPDIDPSSESSSEKLTTPTTVNFSHPVDTRLGYDLSSTSYSAPVSLAHDQKNTKVAEHVLWSSQLDKIERFLVRGDRRGAYHYAADEKLWAHALLIASSVDKEAWKEVVAEFVRSDLANTGTAVSTSRSSDINKKSANGREPLRVAYSLFAGQGAASIQELHPQKPLGAVTQTLPVMPTPLLSTATPMSATFSPPVLPVTLPLETLMKWPQTAAMVICGNLTGESSATLTALGDHLAANNWIEAAHACYLLSPQTSPVGGVGMPGGRVVLYGAANPLSTPTSIKDPDPMIFSEIAEFALSLAPSVKGQDAFIGLPHLQPYRLLRACNLAELGDVELANRYCEAISSSLSRNSPYLNTTFGEQLRSLSDRLVAAPQVDKSGSWIGAKMTRPSLDKIGNWIEGRLTSFIAGEGDSPKPVDTNGKVPTFSGPFAHYSSISSATSSSIPSPQMSSSNLTETPATAPFRTGSAMALRPPSASHAQIARASSAIDYLRRKPSPVPRVSSASAATFTDLPSRAHGQVPYDYMNGMDTSLKADKGDLHTPTIQEDALARSAAPQMGSWWSSVDSDAPTPTATSFSDASFERSSDGFVSLMDDSALSAPSTSSTAKFSVTPRLSSTEQYEPDEEDDLGLGNKSAKPKNVAEVSQEPEKKPQAAAPPPETHKEADKSAAAASGGWLSRLWKRNDSAPGPVKANLGEESSFYYDAEQKRWVNKNAPPEAAKPAAPLPPPLRAQTASPGMSAARGPTTPSPGPPPPARPATAIDLTDGPPKKPPMRVRSNLVPDGSVSAPSTPSSATPSRPPSSMDGPPGLDGPPTPGARRAPPKRNARSRYVDVFQEGSS